MTSKAKKNDNIEPILAPSIRTGVDPEVSFQRGLDSIDHPSQQEMIQPVMTPNSPLVAYNLTPRASNVSSIDAVPIPYASDALLNIEIPTHRLSPPNHSRRLSSLSLTVNDPVKTAFRLSFLCGDPQIPTSPQSYHRPSSGTTSSERTIFSASIRSSSSEEDLPVQVPKNVSDLIGHEFQPTVYEPLDEIVGWQSPSVNTSTTTVSEDHLSSHSFPTPPRRVRIHSETSKIPDSSSKESETFRPSPFSSEKYGSSSRRPMSEINTLPTRRLSVSGTPPLKDLFLGNASQKDSSFEEWVARIQARARACKQSMSTWQRKLTCPSPPPQPSITGAPDEGKVSKKDIPAIRTAVSSFKGEFPSELRSVLSTRSCSCTTTACEVSVHDSVEPRDQHSQHSLPDDLAISRVQRCLLKTETGVCTTFKEVISRSPRTAVIFIRFFWCALCQTYVSKLSESLKDGSPARCRLQASGTKVILIGTGNWRMMASYRGECCF
ncbi:hypothetical protein CROQUDRAFT_135552 [Cronartium quercuum f. sp. fusiforme G11]|uniref:Uncharacterized protein n=1 Tax=Cronartium quercuum f. sp. fusiforme G11 TaxID=708437 RepID=A0A9P6NE41_9BASI|nr:hypothetical protein CROQUDRAFT_135552 [Cronartium quercuum f. sp. fusiforme G11]